MTIGGTPAFVAPRGLLISLRPIVGRLRPVNQTWRRCLCSRLFARSHRIQRSNIRNEPRYGLALDGITQSAARPPSGFDPIDPCPEIDLRGADHGGRALPPTQRCPANNARHRGMFDFVSHRNRARSACISGSRDQLKPGPRPPCKIRERDAVADQKKLARDSFKLAENGTRQRHGARGDRQDHTLT